MVGLLHSLTDKRSKKTKGKLLVKILDSLICSICHDYMFVPMMTQCGHNFCYSCITSWFESNTTTELTCPQCRTSMSEQPHMNSALKGILGNVLESLEEKKDGKEALETLQKSRRHADAEFSLAKKNDCLFNDIFKRSAMGVIDEDDDGILRCSNCHWELEEEDDETCPHCNSRIRSRMAGGNRHQNIDLDDDEEEEDEDTYHSVAEESQEIDDLDQSIKAYKTRVSGYLERFQNEDDSPLRQLENQFPHFISINDSSSSKIYFPSYGMYSAADHTLSQDERERRTNLIERIESTVGHHRSVDELKRSVPNQRDSFTENYTESDFSGSDNSVSEEQNNAVVDLMAEDSNDDNSDYDSEFYEQNEEDDGFVTGDSLDDDARGEEDYIEDDDDDSYGYSKDLSDGDKLLDTPDDGVFDDDDEQDIHDLNEGENLNEKRKSATYHINQGKRTVQEEDDDEDEDIIRIPKRKFQVIRESSDEE